MKAVLFDLYETLVTHFDPDWVPPRQSIAQRLGLEEGTFENLWRRFDGAWQRGEVTHYEEALAQVCAAAQKEPDFALLGELSREHRLIKSWPFKTIEPQIVDLLDTLRQSGLKLGVITNAGDLDAAPWPDCSLAPFFDDFVASHQVALLKPDKRIYELACRRLNVPPTEAIFVSDGGANDLYGATQAGLTVYWCTWFLDRWPEGIRPNGFTGDKWRQYATKGKPPYERLVRPLDLLTKVKVAQ